MLIAQITDLHIVEKNKHWLSQPSTAIHERLSRVVSHINALNPSPDIVLLTGDITEDGSSDSYHHFKELIEPLNIPLYVIPGNHDCRTEMRKVFSQDSYIPSQGFIQYTIEDYPVRLIGLDTLVEGEHYGCLCDERFSWFENQLRAEPKKPTLIFMHHPPVKIGIKLFDQISCLTPAPFKSLIQRADHLMGILAGHYHHLCVSSFENKLCFLAPSVAPVHYFSHPQNDYVSALELEDPAITLHQWSKENGLTSHVVRVKETCNRIDWATIKLR